MKNRYVILYIISYEDKEIVLKVFKLIDDVNKEDKYGNTYLTFACTEINAIGKLLNIGILIIKVFLYLTINYNLGVCIWQSQI